MRIWSLHPKYLDSKGLVALWRETLLAQNVLAGKTKGYKHHPQLLRFKTSEQPLAAIGCYLSSVCDEADARNYNFNRSKILEPSWAGFITVNSGQIDYERKHLLNKLEQRDPQRYQSFSLQFDCETHPLFQRKTGGIEDWEVR